MTRGSLASRLRARLIVRGRPRRPPGARRPAPALTSTSRPGSRRLSQGFFDRYPAFFETSETSSYRWRLNLRHEAIVSENRDLLAGARVLDIASHDGRWSMAALAAGAREVVGIEARPELVQHAERNLRGYGVDESRWRFVTGDVFEVLRDDHLEVDVVLCLGFVYHTLRHHELLARIRRTGAHALVLDTEVIRHPQPFVRIGQEPVAREGNAVADELSFGDVVLTGRPSVSALELMARRHGFALDRMSDWGGLLRDNPEADGVRDYRLGRRVTARFSRREPVRPG